MHDSVTQLSKVRATLTICKQANSMHAVQVNAQASKKTTVMDVNEQDTAV